MKRTGDKKGSRHRLLHAIKLNGPMSASDLASRLGITSIAIRQHLRSLEDDGLVTFEELRGRVGRPSKIWHLTAAANGEFPDQHSFLTVQLLQAIRQSLGEGGLRTILKTWKDREIARYKCHLPEHPVTLSQRLQVLVSSRRQQGYMAEMSRQPDGSLHLIENHCSIRDAAACCPEMCSLEKEAFEGALGDDVDLTRVEHILGGDRRCVYVLRETTPES